MFGYARFGEANEWIYTVRPGDTLWDISEELLLDRGYWRRLQKRNNVRETKHLRPGTKLNIPIKWLKVQPVEARVIHVHGDPKLTIAVSGIVQPLSEGAILSLGDVIRTGTGSSATIEFADGSRLDVHGGSRVVMDRLSEYGRTGMIDTRVRLENGRSRMKVPPKRDPDSRFEIWTPAAISAVRGTDFRVGTDDSGDASRIETLTGNVQFQAMGASVSVRKGFGSTARKGERPRQPVPLLPAPDLSTLPPVIERVPITIALQPVVGAMAYRLQIAADDTFTNLLFDQTYPGPNVRGPDLADGDYVLRIRAIDPLGLEGFDADRSFVLNARPEPPIPIKPTDQGKAREAVPTFRWSGIQGATSYRFRLAHDSDPDHPIVDIQSHKETSFTPEETIKPGFYVWQVSVRDASGDIGPFSDPQRFELKPAPQGSSLEGAETTEDSMTLRWRAGLPGQRYQIQLAKDDRFDEIVIDETLNEPKITLPKPDPGPYYLRIRTIDTDGYLGPYSPVQEFYVYPTALWPLLLGPFIFLAPFL